jgi:hypothetical protein
MAEASSPTSNLYVALAGLLTSSTSAFDRPKWIGFDSTDMLAYTATTNALTGEMSTGGLARGTTTVVVTVATTTIAADTCQLYVSTSPTSAVSIYGVGAFSASTAGNLLAWHRWAAVVNATSTDTIQETLKIQEEIGV